MPRAACIVCAALVLAACGDAASPVVLHPEDAIPERLSEWGVVFADGGTFRLNDGVVPYELNSPLFSDYALKLRTVWLPPGTSAEYAEDREFGFPVGTIISKTFHYERAETTGPANAVVRADRESALDGDGGLDLGEYLLVETRLLVRYATGWKALPYVWNAAQTEATLQVAGDVRELRLVGGGESVSFAYLVPDTNQCGGCHTPDHTAKELRPLGPKAWQLNRPYAWWGDETGQLAHWAAAGLLAGLVGTPPPGIRWSAPGDAPLEARAKAYLDANCAHCHNPAGAADTSALNLHIDAPVDRGYGVCKPPVAVGRGSGDRRYDIWPGRPEASILTFRMEHTDPAIAMPELGRAVIHREGVQLISDWIRDMNGDC